MNEVGLGEYGSVIFLVNDKRLERVLDRALHLLQGSIIKTAKENSDLLERVLAIFEPYWRLVYYQERPTGLKPKNYITILAIGNIILDVPDQKMILALEGIIQPIAEAYRKETNSVALDILESMTKEGYELLRSSTERARYV